MNARVAIVYWGTRGGGARYVRDLASMAADQDLPLLWSLSSKNELLEEVLAVISHQRVHIADLPDRKSSLVNPIKMLRASMDAFGWLKANNVQRIYFAMPHPWDVALEFVAKRHRIQVWRAIHDGRRHRGDTWPSTPEIRSMAKRADKAVFFSSFVRQQFALAPDKVLETSLLSYAAAASAPKSGRVVFVGRIRPYKGLSLLARSWPLVKTQGAELHVLGDGDGLPPDIFKVAHVTNRWLSEVEIDDAIASAHVLILPYQEASQSGLVPIARRLGTPVVITPVGGLLQQIAGYSAGFVAKTLGPEDLAATIDEALSRVPSGSSSEELPGDDFFRALLAF